MLIKRNFLKKFEKYLDMKEIIALTGARQIGKTTVIKYYYNQLKCTQKLFITFEDYDILNLFETNIQLFIEKYVIDNKFLFIDEIQYSKNSGKNLKLIYDLYDIKMIISGSSKSEIAIHSLKYLVGRVLIINMLPLGFDEFIFETSKDNHFLFKSIRKSSEFNLLNSKFQDYLIFGGYPRVILEKDNEMKRDILKNIINTYLLKEIKDVLSYKNLEEFKRIMIRLALLDGSILNMNSIAQTFEIHNNKIKEIITTLENTTILNIIKPYLKNKSKELIKSPKTYFFDLGFKNSLINNFNNLNLRTDKGRIYENFILNSLIKSNINVNYWNYKNLYEMDFVIEIKGKIIGLEVKSKLSKPKITKSIKKFITLVKPQKVYVFCENQNHSEVFDSCEVIFTNHLNIFNIIQEL